MKSITTSVPAPVGGVNARDSLAAMAPTDAITMDNWFPQPSYVSIRNGCEKWQDGIVGQVNTIMAYNGTSTRKLFAAAGTKIYDVTAQQSGSSGGLFGNLFKGLFGNLFGNSSGGTSPVWTSITNAWFQHAMFNSGSGNVLVCVNGVDDPLYYDGTSKNIKTIGAPTGGSGYTNGTYTLVPLTGGTGSGAYATIVVAATAVTTVTITAPGIDYQPNDVLSCSNTYLGGGGSGFAVTVTAIVNGWKACTISGSGLTVSRLITVTVHQQRCWYIEKDSMNVWYALPQGFQGVLTKLPLGTLFKMGGYLMQMASWTIENVSGINAYAAFITSEGEVALYQGFDPSQVATWSLVGIFRIGRPIGRRCYTKLATDIIMITADGLISLNEAVLTDRTEESKTLTYKIQNAINQDVQTYAATHSGDANGWQVIDYPLGNKVIVNVPEQSGVVSHQWVQNQISKAWARFTGWNANCWELQEDNLFFGGDGIVMHADTGANDNGLPITIDCKPAFSYFDSPGKQKRFVMARPMMQANAKFSPLITLNLDFNDIQNSPIPLKNNTLPLWNVAIWDITYWTIGVVINRDWQGLAGIGYAASGRITLQTMDISANWFSTDYMLEPGGPL